MAAAIRRPVILLLLVMSILASGCTKNARLDTIHAAMTGTEATYAGFKTWKKQHEQSIVDAADKAVQDGKLTKAEAKVQVTAQLAEFRSNAAEVIAKLAQVLLLLDLATTAADDPSLKAALAAVADFAAFMKTFQEKGAP